MFNQIEMLRNWLLNEKAENILVWISKEEMTVFNKTLGFCLPINTRQLANSFVRRYGLTELEVHADGVVLG